MPEAKDFATPTAPLCAAPDPEPRGPARYRVSAGAVDTHADVIGPRDRADREAIGVLAGAVGCRSHGFCTGRRGRRSSGLPDPAVIAQGWRRWVKLSGAFRVSAAGAPYHDAIPFAQALMRARPDRMVWGSDWPHVSISPPMPRIGELLDLLADWIPDADQRQRVLADNPRRLYGFADTH